MTGRVLATIPAPDGGAPGMAWVEGMLWVGQRSACDCARTAGAGLRRAPAPNSTRLRRLNAEDFCYGNYLEQIFSMYYIFPLNKY
jgi:hypothetical protein